LPAFEALFRAAFFPMERIILELLREQWDALRNNIDMRLSDKTREINKQKKEIADLRQQLRLAKGDPRQSDASGQAPQATRAVRGNADINKRLKVRYSSMVTETIAAAAVMGLRTTKPYGVRRVLKKLLEEKEKPLHESRHWHWPKPGEMGACTVWESKQREAQWRLRMLKQEEHLVKFWS
jgi:hypothetical protein